MTGVSTGSSYVVKAGGAECSDVAKYPLIPEETALDCLR